METNLKKALSIFGVVCFSMASLSAGSYDNDDQNDNSNHRVGVAPGVHQGDGPCFSVNADYIFWWPRQNGLAYAVTGDYSATGVAAPARGKVHYPQMKGQSGFKVGLETCLDHDSWDISAEYLWLWFSKPAWSSTTVTGNQAITGYWNDAPAIHQKGITSIGSYWHNHFNRIDVELTRTHYAGHYLQLGPSLGFMGAWEDQYFGVRSKSATTVTTYDTWELTQGWWGVGPMASLSSAFMFPMGDSQSSFSVFIDSGMALALAYTGVTKDLKNNDSTPTFDVSSSDSYWDIEPVLDMTLGLRYATWFTDGANVELAFEVYWEQQVYFDHGALNPMGSEAFAAHSNYTQGGPGFQLKVAF